MTNTKRKLHITVGFPGSGKTTWVNKNINNNHAVVVSLDDLREMMIGHEFFEPAEPFVHAMGKTMVRYLLEKGHEVVLDSTALTKGIRAQWIRIAKSVDPDLRIICIHVDFPIEGCIKRNENRTRKVPVEVMLRMKNQFESPEKEEGFDELLRYRWV